MTASRRSCESLTTRTSTAQRRISLASNAGPVLRKWALSPHQRYVTTAQAHTYVGDLALTCDHGLHVQIKEILETKQGREEPKYRDAIFLHGACESVRDLTRCSRADHRCPCHRPQLFLELAARVQQLYGGARQVEDETVRCVSVLARSASHIGADRPMEVCHRHGATWSDVIALAFSTMSILSERARGWMTASMPQCKAGASRSARTQSSSVADCKVSLQAASVLLPALSSLSASSARSRIPTLYSLPFFFPSSSSPTWPRPSFSRHLSILTLPRLISRYPHTIALSRLLRPRLAMLSPCSSFDTPEVTIQAVACSSIDRHLVHVHQLPFALTAILHAQSLAAFFTLDRCWVLVSRCRRVLTSSGR